jgi:hypothetical protein
MFSKASYYTIAQTYCCGRVVVSVLERLVSLDVVSVLLAAPELLCDVPAAPTLSALVAVVSPGVLQKENRNTVANKTIACFIKINFRVIQQKLYQQVRGDCTGIPLHPG